MIDSIGDPFLNDVALGLLLFMGLMLFYGIIAIHDIPYKIAKRREHPHQDAIHAAGWVSLFTLHVLWPFLWIWAMAYRPERGWGFSQSPKVQNEIEALRSSVEQLSTRLAQFENQKATRVISPNFGPTTQDESSVREIKRPASVDSENA